MLMWKYWKLIYYHSQCSHQCESYVCYKVYEVRFTKV